MKPLFLAFLVGAISTVLTSPDLPAPSPTSPTSRAIALFVLGDSSVNCGDNSIMNIFLPHNLTSSPVFTGFCRRLLPDFIAEKMGLPSPPTFYSGNWTSAAIASGVNFGSTPATIISPSIAADSPIGPASAGGGFFLFQTLNQQVRQVYETLQLLRLETGPTAVRRVASSLFLLSFGRDDYTGIFSESNISSRPKYGRRGIGRLLVSQMIQAVKVLYNAGARRIVVLGAGPLGCTPRVRWKAAYGLQGNRCVEEANEMVDGYNTRLADRLREVEQELPGARVVFCDIYKGMMEIISNPQLYGFSNARDACCGGGFFGGMIGCLSKDMVCSEPSRHVWWDLYGTTEAVDALLADWSWSPLPEKNHICTPISLQQLAD